MPIVAGVWDRGVSVVRAHTLQILAHLPDAGLRSWCNEAKGDPNRLLYPRGNLIHLGIHLRHKNRQNYTPTLTNNTRSSSASPNEVTKFQERLLSTGELTVGWGPGGVDRVWQGSTGAHPTLELHIHNSLLESSRPDMIQNSAFFFFF